MFNILTSVILYITSFQITPASSAELYIKEITVSAGTFDDKITVKWQGTVKKQYKIYRSMHSSTGFEEIARTDQDEFNDTNIEKGVVYWYRVAPLSDSTEIKSLNSDEKKIEAPDQNTIADASHLINEEEYNKLSSTPSGTDEPASGENSNQNKENNSITLNCFSGYASNRPAPGEDLDILIKEKKSVLKTPKNSKMKSIQEVRLKYLEQYYMHPVKFSLIMTLSRPYLKKGEIQIFTGKNIFEIYRERREFVFHDPDYKTYIVFQSKKFLKIIDQSQDSELAELLIKNAEIFCIPGGKKKITDTEGKTRIVNYYDAIGMSTRFLKNDRDWRSRTIMVSTSRKDLKEMIKKAARPEQPEDD